MPTLFALVGQNLSERDHLPLLGDDDRESDAAAAPDQPGETTKAVAEAQPTIETWVEWLLLLLTITLAVAAWAQILGNVFR